MAGNSLANAIVTLVPKFDGGATAALENQLEKSGHTGGAKMANATGAALKKLAAAGVIAAAGKMAGDIFAGAFNNAANYEQLSGGVEKIFDEMDRSQIFADARGAYKDLNMSANEYLEIINDVGASFSATMGDEKGYNVARQGLKAIADYSSGTGKNLDVLKDKFGMITRSTSSYQSIADQFSGILPATSDGFLQAAKGAGLLSDEYTKLTEVPIDEYQAAVSGMLEQGVKDLGLYDNTVKETENTVSGSLAALKASWDNMLTAIGTGENVEETADQLVDSFITALSNIIPLAAQVIKGMGSALVSAIGDLLVQGVNKIAAMYGEFEAAAGDLIRGLVNGILAAPGAVADALIQVAKDAKDAFCAFWGINSPSRVMAELGGYMGEGLTVGIDREQGRVQRSMENLVTAAWGDPSVAFSGAGARGGTVYNVYVNGAVVNSDSAIQDSVYNFLNNLQRRAAM